MKLKDLIECLSDVADTVEDGSEMEVTFGYEMEPVEGGMVGSHEGATVLNLTPVSFSGRPGAF